MSFVTASLIVNPRERDSLAAKLQALGIDTNIHDHSAPGQIDIRLVNEGEGEGERDQSMRVNASTVTIFYPNEAGETAAVRFQASAVHVP